MEIPEPNTQTRPTADIALSEQKDGIIQNESFQVIPKSSDSSDFMRPLKMSDIRKIEDLAKNLQTSSIHWDEVLLAVASLGFGSTLSALLSDTKLDTSNGIIFFVIVPIISFSATVFVVMYKILKSKTTNYAGKEIEKIIESYIDKPKDKK